MKIQDYLKREQEVRQAEKEFPGIEVGEAYRRWKEIRGEKATMLHSGDKELENEKIALLKKAEKPCTVEGCSGLMVLESICAGCVEGRKGYKSKWTCQECLHRELLKKDYFECLKELSLSVKQQS